MSMSAIRSSGLGDSGSEKDEKAERDEVGLERHVTLDIRHENATTCRNWRNNSIRFRKCRHIQLDSFVYLATQGLCLFFFRYATVSPQMQTSFGQDSVPGCLNNTSISVKFRGICRPCKDHVSVTSVPPSVYTSRVSFARSYQQFLVCPTSARPLQKRTCPRGDEGCGFCGLRNTLIVGRSICVRVASCRHL